MNLERESWDFGHGFRERESWVFSHGFREIGLSFWPRFRERELGFRP